MARINVVIPTYNRAQLLKRAVDSVFSQTFKDLETIIVDDGSEDETSAVAQQYRNCRYFKITHSGLPGVPRNLGVRMANSEYIAFLDSDDEWLTHKLEFQARILDAHSDVGLVCSNAFVIKNDERDSTKTYLKPGHGNTGRVLKDLLRDNFIITSTVLMRRNVFEAASGFSEEPLLRIGEDYDLWLRVAALTKIHYIPEPLALYRETPSSLSRSIGNPEHWRVMSCILERAARNVYSEMDDRLSGTIESSLETSRRAECDAYLAVRQYANFSKTLLTFARRRPVGALKYLMVKLAGTVRIWPRNSALPTKWGNLKAVIRNKYVDALTHAFSIVLNWRVPSLTAPAAGPNLSFGASSPTWTRHGTSIQNPSRDLSHFLRWPEIRQTMFVDRAPYVELELRSLQERADWATRWKRAIQESPVGDPIRYWRYPRSSGNLIHHAYHVSTFEKLTHRSVDTLAVVLEFGGGYGSMCRLLRNLGFGGDYAILDLPPLSRIQASYLGAMGHRAHLMTDPEASVRWALAANGKTLFIATWSLSEAPLPVRDQVLPLIERADHVLIAFQSEFDGIDNLRFFGDYLQQHVQKNWRLVPIESMRKSPPNDFYLIA